MCWRAPDGSRASGTAPEVIEAASKVTDAFGSSETRKQSALTETGLRSVLLKRCADEHAKKAWVWAWRRVGDA